MNAPLRSVLDVMDLRTKRRERAVRSLREALSDDALADWPEVASRLVGEFSRDELALLNRLTALAMARTGV